MWLPEFQIFIYNGEDTFKHDWVGAYFCWPRSQISPPPQDSQSYKVPTSVKSNANP